MRLYYLLAIITVLFACNKEAALTADPAAPLYTLPQGNHSYDDTIMTHYKKYGSYILYRFTQGDYSYNYIDRKSDSAFNANPAYIGTALRFFKTQLLDLYPEAFLQKTMPFKILLASYIGTSTTRNAKGFSSTNNMLAIGWADSTLAQKTPAELKQLRAYMHRFYIERAYRVKTITVPAAFVALAPPLYSSITAATKYSNGILAPTGTDLNLAIDFLEYVEVIAGTTKAELENTFFKPTVDTRGLIRQKYEIVVNYFLTIHGVDLQAIGDMP
jgi:hypothetical protein